MLYIMCIHLDRKHLGEGIGDEHDHQFHRSVSLRRSNRLSLPEERQEQDPAVWVGFCDGCSRNPVILHVAAV